MVQSSWCRNILSHPIVFAHRKYRGYFSNWGKAMKASFSFFFWPTLNMKKKK